MGLLQLLLEHWLLIIGVSFILVAIILLAMFC